jgi:hypothetical protein
LKAIGVGVLSLLVAGTIAGSITVRGLDLSSTQADRKIMDALMNANAAIAMEAKGIQAHPEGCEVLNLMQLIALIYFRH